MLRAGRVCGRPSASANARVFCPAAPGAPGFLAFSEVTSTTLNVSWGEPAAANGILQGYRVVYEPLAPVQGEPGAGKAAPQGGLRADHGARGWWPGARPGPGPRSQHGVWGLGCAHPSTQSL